MKKTKHDSQPHTSRQAINEEPAVPPATHELNGGKRREDQAFAEELLDEATRWVRANQTVALLGAFGIGVFVGVLLRK
jgi:hypothetical protein